MWQEHGHHKHQSLGSAKEDRQRERQEDSDQDKEGINGKEIIGPESPLSPVKCHQNATTEELITRRGGGYVGSS